jgi:hypothetical protein
MNHPDRLEAWEHAIRGLEAEGRQAFLERDLDRLEQLWSDRLLVNSPLNTVNSKRKVLELLGAGVIAHATYDTEIEHVQRYGDVVVVMGSETVTHSTAAGAVRRRFTDLWQMEGGTWKMIARHANVIH